MNLSTQTVISCAMACSPGSSPPHPLLALPRVHALLRHLPAPRDCADRLGSRRRPLFTPHRALRSQGRALTRPLFLFCLLTMAAAATDDRRLKVRVTEALRDDDFPMALLKELLSSLMGMIAPEDRGDDGD
eukprot:COSAG06_NODE_17282_length_950_cov_3.654524_1_plen_130_part_10